MMIKWLKKKYFFNEIERDAWVQRQASQVPAGTAVLDVGAGSCPYQSFFTHCEYRTHDFSLLSSELLRGKRGYGVVDIVSDICNIPVPDASFDLILCTEVLEHVPEPIRAIRELGRICKPGGRILLSAPLGSGLHQEPYHFYGGYTPHWYRKFLSEAGFADICIEPNRGFFSHYGQECVRFICLLAPWKGWRNALWLPLWLFGMPWCWLVPLCASQLDKQLDRHKGFTVGYHVKATKAAFAGKEKV